MTSPVSPTAGIENITAVYGGRAERPSPDTDAFLQALDRGIGTLTTRPDPGPENKSSLDAVQNEYGGDVGAAKVEMLGGNAVPDEAASGAEGRTLEQRMQSLYMELTHYQIAWRIAQNVQRDISQLMRGS